jgi:Ca-activated chloride channel homolog
MLRSWRVGPTTLVLLFALVSLNAAPQDAPRVVIHAPSEDDYVSGVITIAASVEGVRPDFVTFYADGVARCRLGAPPWVCRYDAGDTVREHHLRVVAELSGGRRLTASRRTKAIDYAERAEVDAVLVPVSVRKDGRFVKGLRAQDFRILEDGRPQEITFFGAEGLSLELIVTMDVSGSMEDDMPAMREAVKAFLRALRTEDRVVVAAFNTAFFVVSGRDAQQNVRLRAIDRLTAWGGTALFDALVRSADLLQRRPGRKAIVVFTDGDDQSSRTSAEAAERRMESSDAILYVIGQGQGGRNPDLRSRLQRLARVSGGRSFFTSDITELRGAFAEIVEDLANQYAIAYTPERPPDDSWRRIDVEVRGNYDVRARQGYRAVRRQGSE